MYSQIKGATNGIQGFYSQASPQINGTGAAPKTNLEPFYTLATLADPYVLLLQKQKYMKDNYQQMMNKKIPGKNIMRSNGDNNFQEGIYGNIAAAANGSGRFTGGNIEEFGEMMYKGFKNFSKFYSAYPQQTNERMIQGLRNANLTQQQIQQISGIYHPDYAQQINVPNNQSTILNDTGYDREFEEGRGGGDNNMFDKGGDPNLRNATMEQIDDRFNFSEDKKDSSSDALEPNENPHTRDQRNPEDFVNFEDKAGEDQEMSEEIKREDEELQPQVSDSFVARVDKQMNEVQAQREAEFLRQPVEDPDAYLNGVRGLFGEEEDNDGEYFEDARDHYEPPAESFYNVKPMNPIIFENIDEEFGAPNEHEEERQQQPEGAEGAENGGGGEME